MNSSQSAESRSDSEPDALQQSDHPIADEPSIIPLPGRSRAGQESATTDSEIPAADLETHFGLTRRDQIVVGVLMLAILAMLGAHWLRLSGWGMKPVEIDRLPEREYAYRIDINRATWIQWYQLEGIGETLADRIVKDREENGPFESIDDLIRVRGIGKKKLESIRPWLKIEQEEQPEPAPVEI